MGAVSSTALAPLERGGLPPLSSLSKAEQASALHTSHRMPWQAGSVLPEGTPRETITNRAKQRAAWAVCGI